MEKTKRLIPLAVLFMSAGLVLAACERDTEGGSATSPVVSSTPAGEEAGEMRVSLVPLSAEGSEGQGGGAESADAFTLKLPWAQAAPLANVASISTGRIFDAAGYGWKPGISYGITEDGTAWAWGYSPTGKDDAYPRKIVADRPIVQLSGSYMLTDDGQVRRIGASAAPVQGLDGVKAIQQLDEMFGTLFVLKSDGTVWVLKRDAAAAERFGTYESITGIWSTSFSLFMLDNDGKLLFVAGSSGDIMQNEALAVHVPEKVRQMAANSRDEALIQAVDGGVYRFSPVDQSVTPVPQAAGAKGLAITDEGGCLFVKEDGSVWGFGSSNDGILGPAGEPVAVEPLQLEGLQDIVEITAGTHHVLALDSSGYVYSWGSNMTNQLGRMEQLLSTWTDLGVAKGIRKAVTLLEQPYFIRDDGFVWLIDENLQSRRVAGPAGVEDLTFLYGFPLILTANGEIQLWSPSFDSGMALSLPFPVKSMAASDESLLLLARDGRMFTVSFQPERGDAKVEAVVPKELKKTEGASWTGQVKSLHANSDTFLVLADDGKVYYTNRDDGGAYVFEQVAGLPPITELAAQYFIRYTAEPAQVWAMDKDGQVHTIVLSPEWGSEGGVRSIQKVQAQVSEEKEQGIAAISGKLRITEDGYLLEPDLLPPSGEKLPERVRLVSSGYRYGIEGPGSHYHVLLTEQDHLVILGYNPFGREASRPGKVIVP